VEDVSFIRLPAKGMACSERGFSIRSQSILHPTRFKPEDVGNIFLRNVGIRLQDYAFSQPGRLQSIVQYKFSVALSKLVSTPVPTSHYEISCHPRSLLIFIARVCYATSRKVAGSIADEIIGFFS
jgi:hypothetical protein